jgi:hypothetical protein
LIDDAFGELIGEGNPTATDNTKNAIPSSLNLLDVNATPVVST